MVPEREPDLTPEDASGVVVGIEVQVPKTSLVEPLRVEVLALEEVVEGVEEEQPLTSMQSTLVTAPPLNHLVLAGEMRGP